jgi:5'-deoxynucleotidase YfbR-like HD superfamily hydrolase
MLSGRRLDILNPSPLDIEIEDIAHGLSRVARWNGQTSGSHAFSVAQHSILVVQIMQLINSNLTNRELLAGLLHDAPEYVIGDLISPFKRAVGADYKSLENSLMAAIHLRFSLPARMSVKLAHQLKKADIYAAHLEATSLAGFSHEGAFAAFGQLPDVSLPGLVTLPSNEAKAEFLSKFEQLSY